MTLCDDSLKDWQSTSLFVLKFQAFINIDEYLRWKKIDENIISHSIFDNNQFSKSCHRKEGVTVGGLSLAASYMAQVEQSFISRNFAAKIGTVRTI